VLAERPATGAGALVRLLDVVALGAAAVVVVDLLLDGVKRGDFCHGAKRSHGVSAPAWCKRTKAQRQTPRLWPSLPPALDWAWAATSTRSTSGCFELEVRHALTPSVQIQRRPGNSFHGRHLGLIGFDSESETELTVLAALACHEERANRNCERQRGTRCGESCLAGADAPGVRAAHRCETYELDVSSLPSSRRDQAVVEAPAPRRQGCQSSKLDTHVSEVLESDSRTRVRFPAAPQGRASVKKALPPSSFGESGDEAKELPAANRLESTRLGVDPTFLIPINPEQAVVQAAAARDLEQLPGACSHTGAASSRLGVLGATYPVAPTFAVGPHGATAFLEAA
jgi:hypothetical protein